MIETIVTVALIWIGLVAFMVCLYGLEVAFKKVKRIGPWEERSQMSDEARALLARLEADPTLPGSKAWREAHSAPQNRPTNGHPNGRYP